MPFRISQLPQRFLGIRLPRTRTGWLLLALLFVLGFLAGVYLSKDGEDSTLAGGDRAFAVEDTDGIRKIFLAHRDGYTATLERAGEGWTYNGRYRANPDAMRNLLHAIATIRMKYRPPEAMEETMIRSLAGRGIKVEIYGAGEQPIKTYYVGGATADERGTYLMMEGAKQPYVGELADWEGNLRFRYNLRGDDWRDKTVFALDVDAIERVAVAYPRQRDASFVLERNGNAYTIRAFYPGPGQAPQAVQRGRVEAYYYGFRDLRAEAFENSNPRRDSILSLTPFCTIEVETADGQVRQARFFPIRPGGGGGSPFDAGAGPGSPPVNRYFLALDSGDLLLVQDRVFRQLFLDRDFFLEPL